MSDKGKLFYRFGTMASGKSLQLLAMAHNFHERGVSFFIIKSTIDNRDGENVIHSRALGDRECISVDPSTNLYSFVEKLEESSKEYGYNELQWILVDEAQFLTAKQVDELAAIVDNLGINVMCYGLRTDFQTHLFEGSKRLFEIADSIEEIKSSCDCGSKTIFNARINGNGEIVTDGDQIEVGGDDRYIALCRKCYMQKTKNNLY